MTETIGRIEVEKLEKSRAFWILLNREIGSGANRWAPPGEGTDGSGSLCASSTHARNPAMGPACWELGPYLCFNMGPGFRDWVPLSRRSLSGNGRCLLGRSSTAHLLAHADSTS